MHDSHHTARKYHGETKTGGADGEGGGGMEGRKKDICGDEEREKTAGV